MERARTPRKQRWLGWTWSKEDEDVMACQVISAFSWIILILLINFFFLHKSNTIPAAEATWAEPQTALRPPALPRPLPQLAMFPDRVPWEVSREFVEDDYKPNYFFLYKDQIRFVDRIPKKKTILASRKTLVPPPVAPEPEEPVKKELEKPLLKPLQLDWVDMTMVEEAEPEKRKREEEPPPVSRTIKIAMVENLDLDMQIVEEPPEPLAPRKPREVPRQALPKMRASAVDVDMELMEPPPLEQPPRVVAPGPRPRQPVLSVSAGADYVALPIEIDSGTSAFPTTAVPSDQPARKGTAHRMLIAKGPAGPAVDVPISMEIGETRDRVSRSGSIGSIKKKTKGAGFAAVTGKGVGGIDLPVGIFEGEGNGKGTGRPKRVASASPAKKKSVRVTLQSTKGSIRLGTSLAFALADVGSETHTGSAYIRKSTRLKRLLEQQALPEEPVTVSTSEAIGDQNGSTRLVAVSYSRAQVVLQYANGKQHVINLVQGEPYPRFELRRSADGAGSVPVGTKLEEISSCLSTLQQVLKE